MKMSISPKRRIVAINGMTFSVPKYIYAAQDTGWQIILKVGGKLLMTKQFAFADFHPKKRRTKDSIQKALDAAEAALAAKLATIDVPERLTRLPKISRYSKSKKPNGSAHYVQGAVGANWARIYVGTDDTITTERVTLAARTMVGRMRHYVKQRQAGAVLKSMHMPKSIPMPRASDKEVQRVVSQFK